MRKLNKKPKPMSARKGEDAMFRTAFCSDCVNKMDEEITDLKTKLHKRNVQIKRLQAEIGQLKDVCKQVARRISQDIADNPAAKTDRPEIFAMLDKVLNR